MLQQQNRRDFLKTGVLAFGGALILPSCLKDYSPWQFFSEEEAACVSAICEQIIPTDELGPGAAYAGVIFYIDKQLDEIFLWDRELYRKGIPAIQESADILHSKKFEELGFEEQTRFLELMEKNSLPGDLWEDSIRQSDFFRKITQHSMQGFYGSPRHGGNKNYISYKLMKLDYPYIVGQNRYRELTKKEG